MLNLIDWLIDWLFLDCKTVRIFANSSTREQSNLKRGWKLRARLGRDGRVRLARLARMRVKLNRFWEKNWLFCSLDFFLPMSHTCFAHLRLRLAHALEQALPGLSGCTVAPGTQGGLARRQSQATHDSCVCFETKGLFTWSGGRRSSGVGFFCFHALGGTKQKKPTPPDRGPPLHVNRF